MCESPNRDQDSLSVPTAPNRIVVIRDPLTHKPVEVTFSLNTGDSTSDSDSTSSDTESDGTRGIINLEDPFNPRWVRLPATPNRDSRRIPNRSRSPITLQPSASSNSPARNSRSSFSSLDSWTRLRGHLESIEGLLGSIHNSSEAASNSQQQILEILGFIRQENAQVKQNFSLFLDII